jgi:hypothetical protein
LCRNGSCLFQRNEASYSAGINPRASEHICPIPFKQRSATPAAKIPQLKNGFTASDAGQPHFRMPETRRDLGFVAQSLAAIDVAVWADRSGGHAYFFADLSMAVCAFSGLQRSHRHPGIRQLAATVQAHRIAGLVERKRTSLVAVRASKQQFKPRTNHRLPPSRIGRADGNVRSAPMRRSQSGYGPCFHPIFPGWHKRSAMAQDLPWPNGLSPIASQ